MANLTHNLNTFEEVIQIRKLIASIYCSVKKDYKTLWEDNNEKETFYEVGMLVGYSKSINKDDLAGKFINKFMNE